MDFGGGHVLGIDGALGGCEIVHEYRGEPFAEDAE
jgi:hypothetical protein